MLKTVSSATNAIGALNFKGTWNAATNTPTIVSGVGVKGDYFVVSVAGSTTIDGISNWGIGDWIVYNGNVWQRVEGGADLNGVNLTVTNTTTLSGLTASTALALDASKNVVSVSNTGTGDNVLATSPTLVTPALGTPSALVGTNITGTATAFTASNVTTNANLTGAVTSTGNATLLGSFSSANLAGALTDETGTGALVFATSPTLVTPVLGTPSSGTVTNLTGTASININGTVGATTANTGAFTTLSATGVTTLQAGAAGASNIIGKNTGNNTSPVLTIGIPGDGFAGAAFFGINNQTYTSSNAGAAPIRVGSSTTGRSINAAGTINASGTDYAEYMTKADNFTIAKGNICGVNANGKLTNSFTDAVAFVVKSTNPSYVGGDSWGNDQAIGSRPVKPTQRAAEVDEEGNETQAAETDEDFAARQAQYETDLSEFEAKLEAERQKVDRIAFSGQVPVNVTGTTAGQYIVPVENNGEITGVAINEADITLAQYMKAVGKVIAIEDDGRARIIVKVA